MNNPTAVPAASIPSTPAAFDYVQLSEVDPTFKPIPANAYTLKIMKAEKKEFTYKQTRPKAGITAGDIGQYVKFQLAVVDDPNFAGRRLFETLFFGARELRILRRLADAIGVPQDAGVAFDDWLKKLSEEQPEFKTKVTEVEETNHATGQLEAVNKVDWNTLYPAA